MSSTYEYELKVSLLRLFIQIRVDFDGFAMRIIWEPKELDKAIFICFCRNSNASVTNSSVHFIKLFKPEVAN